MCDFHGTAMHPFCGRLVSGEEGYGATYTCQAPEAVQDPDDQDARIMLQVMDALFLNPALKSATFVRDEVVASLRRTGMDDEGLSHFIDFSLEPAVAKDFFPQGLCDDDAREDAMTRYLARLEDINYWGSASELPTLEKTTTTALRACGFEVDLHLQLHHRHGKKSTVRVQGVGSGQESSALTVMHILHYKMSTKSPERNHFGLLLEDWQADEIREILRVLDVDLVHPEYVLETTPLRDQVQHIHRHNTHTHTHTLTPTHTHTHHHTPTHQHTNTLTLTHTQHTHAHSTHTHTHTRTHTHTNSHSRTNRTVRTAICSQFLATTPVSSTPAPLSSST
jgi:hypothetical protein